MKFNIGQIFALIGQLAVDVEVDEAELAASAAVKVGQVGSTGGKPVYVYLSEDANLVDSNSAAAGVVSVTVPPKT